MAGDVGSKALIVLRVVGYFGVSLGIILWLSYEETYNLYVVCFEMPRDSSEFQSLRLSLRIAFSIAVMVALTGVALFWAQTTSETRTELGVHITLEYAYTVGLRFKDKYTAELYAEHAQELSEHFAKVLNHDTIAIQGRLNLSKSALPKV